MFKMIEARPTQLAPLCAAQMSAGAMTRSTCCGFAGCAAGQMRILRDDGTARAPLAAHERDDEVVVVLPAAQPAQAPEHEADVSPAEAPNVPLGQSEQVAEPASEYVPGQHGKHDDEASEAKVPAGHGWQVLASVAPVAAEKVPGEQGTHVIALAMLEYVPPGQG